MKNTNQDMDINIFEVGVILSQARYAFLLVNYHVHYLSSCEWK